MIVYCGHAFGGTLVSPIYPGGKETDYVAIDELSILLRPDPVRMFGKSSRNWVVGVL